MDQVLYAEGLTKRFADVTAIDGLNLSCRAGECLALLGRNGAGKTTTVEILEGLQHPDAGVVRLFGQEYRNARRAIQQRIGVVLQETVLYKRFSVRETLELFASMYNRSVPVSEVIDRLGLDGKADTKLMNLSGGMRQRVSLGAALVNEPELLFLDEPTTGLDPSARIELWDFITGLKRQGVSVILTTHYMEEAERLADRIAIMDRGKIIAEGKQQDLCGRYGCANLTEVFLHLTGSKIDDAEATR